ncbi:uroporphyrinogen-III C-methyltransferase [Gilvimarinus agarilyticus]|uniref:uroporphyrinogen-III C-methyltransferase n=1 Tax=Gilvimarinus sp. 2_MG-2023 TaxID=3062666 RepID=UPI001C0A086E|nr:uroporphyrinogen-III C-methyltransferase [Gilvimarinus sp. 2_MG-2023]MBU2884546.1 uroporphyrinogen-III C-methyltransferase [Gilvimarinus agarilyticus]MDO6569674.1 uroporphyrinogen-III C-methyltransferase [Gilvimarinus sp. 2_MG-2023]
MSLNSKMSSQPGKVLLVGAGPGDAELLTLKALKAIESADVIFYDQLVSQEIRALFPKSTPAIYVGKVKNHHSVAQTDLNQMLVEHAKRGLNVCRIKGGDPFVFGRGGEELLTLRQAGCDAEVIPGITAASGCTTAADIPLTHRGVAQGCTFVTGHGEKDLNLNWQALANLSHTLVFYMGVSKAEHIQTQLLQAGMSGHTPAAFIENGCRKNQRVVTTTVGELFQTGQEHGVQSPALIVVGEVVLMAQQLQDLVSQQSTGQPESLSA